jgi:hypothetical protein
VWARETLVALVDKWTRASTGQRYTNIQLWTNPLGTHRLYSKYNIQRCRSSCYKFQRTDADSVFLTNSISLAAPVFQMLFWDRPQQHTHPVVNAFLNELHKHVSSNLRISPCIPCFGSASTSLPTHSRLLSLLLSHPSPAFRILLEGCCGQSEYRVQRKHQL